MSNNNTTLVELAKHLNFDLKQRCLCCIGYILNLITEQYLFGQDMLSFEADFKKASLEERQQL